MKNLIVDFIRFIHLFLVIILLSSVFIPNYEIKKFSYVLLIFLFFQYITNYGKCGLTQLEYLILGERYEEGFLYRVIKPIINRSEEYVNNKIYIIHVLWIIILGYQLGKL